MIHVLKNWSQVGQAIGYLSSLGTDKQNRVYHGTPVKNWDLAQLANVLKNENKDIRILDMGCGGSSFLRFCYVNKFRNVYGIDLTIHFQDRWQQLMYFKNNNFRLPYHLLEQDITKTNFEDYSFDFLVCLSVIEHNVNLDKFLEESCRLLKKNGLLYISTDYWDKKIDTSDAPSMYGAEPGQDWNIFSKEEINSFIQSAKRYGLLLKKEGIPNVGKPIIEWNSKKYTFLSMVLIKK